MSVERKFCKIRLGSRVFCCTERSLVNHSVRRYSRTIANFPLSCDSFDGSEYLRTVPCSSGGQMQIKFMLHLCFKNIEFFYALIFIPSSI